MGGEGLLDAEDVRVLVPAVTVLEQEAGVLLEGEAEFLEVSCELDAVEVGSR